MHLRTKNFPTNLEQKAIHFGPQKSGSHPKLFDTERKNELGNLVAQALCNEMYLLLGVCVCVRGGGVGVCACVCVCVVCL